MKNSNYNHDNYMWSLLRQLVEPLLLWVFKMVQLKKQWYSFVACLTDSGGFAFDEKTKLISWTFLGKGSALNFESDGDDQKATRDYIGI